MFFALIGILGGLAIVGSAFYFYDKWIMSNGGLSSTEKFQAFSFLFFFAGITALLAVIYFLFNPNIDEIDFEEPPPIESVSQLFLYQKDSIIDLPHHGISTNFYRYTGHTSDNKVTLVKTDCVLSTSEGYDFSGCANGSYYPIDQFEEGTLIQSTHQLGQGIHWINEYSIERTQLSDIENSKSGDTSYLISIDCPFNQDICRTMQVNDTEYPILFQQGISPVRILAVDIQYIDSETSRWEWQMNDAEASVSNDFVVSLAVYYDTAQLAMGPGSSPRESQVINHGAFNHFKFSGALKGRWHRDHIEADQWGVARWQRIETQGQQELYFNKNPKLLFPSNFNGIAYHNQNRPSRLIDMHLVDLDEDGLDDVLSVYSDNYKTEIRYRDLIDLEKQSPNYEKVLTIPDVVNIDQVQLVSGTHHVDNRQDGVHYLLLQSKADKKLFLVALVQPMSADLTQPDSAFDALQVVTVKHSINNVLASNGLWQGDPIIDFQRDKSQVTLSWIETNAKDSVYIDPNQLVIQTQSYSLISSNTDNGAQSYQLQAVGEQAALKPGNIKRLENPECTEQFTYSYAGHFSLRLINSPDSSDDQLGAVVSTTDRCELIRAMDPYHRGKSDRLLVMNHRDELNAWRYSHVSSSIPDKPFEFYMDFTSGNYQVLKTSSSLESAAYQYPLSQALQSQNLSFDETGERYRRQNMLRDYCLKQNIDEKDCLHQWLKNALETHNDASEYSHCDSHKALNTSMINCIRNIVLAKLNQLPHGTNLESNTHKFEFTKDDGDSILKRTNLSTKNTDHINVNNLFEHLSDTLSLTQQHTSNQLNNPALKQPIWTDLVASTINTFIPPANAGAEIAACLALGPFALECAAVDLILSVAVVAFAASKTYEWTADDFDSGSQNQASLASPEQQVAQHIPFLSEPEQMKTVFEQSISELLKDGTKGFVAGLTAAEVCSLLAEMALLDPEPSTKTALAVIDGVCWVSLMVTSYIGEKHYNYRLQPDNQRLEKHTNHSDINAGSLVSGLSEAMLIRVTNDGIASNAAKFSSTNNSQIKPCKDDTDLCLDDTLRIRQSDNGSVEVISLHTGSVSLWWHAQLGKNETTGLPQLTLSMKNNDEKVLTYDVIKKDKQGHSIFGLTSLKRVDHEGTQHFYWTYNAFGQVISVVSGIEKPSEEIELVSSWAFYHQLMNSAPEPLLDFVIRYDNQAFNGDVDMQASEHYSFKYTKQEGHLHQLREIEKIVNGEVTGYLKLGASATKAKPLAEMYKPCDSNNSRCYAIDQKTSNPDISRTYAIPAMVYQPNSAMWLPVLGFGVDSNGIKLKTLSPTSGSLCPTQYEDFYAPGNDLWSVNDISQLQIPQPLQQVLSSSLKIGETYYFKGTQIALASMAKALLNRSGLSAGVGKVMEEMQVNPIEIKNKDGQWTNVSTLFNATADESESESETQSQPDGFSQTIANLAELLGLQIPHINNPIGEIDENLSVEQLAELLCPVTSSPDGDGSPNNDYEEGECKSEEPGSDEDQSETKNLQAYVPSLPLGVLMEYVERDPQGFHNEMQKVLKKLQKKLSEHVKVNELPLNFDSQAYSRSDSSGRRRLDGEDQSNDSEEHKIPLINIYPADAAVALYFKIPKNKKMSQGRRVEIEYDPTSRPEHIFGKHIDGTNFYKALVVYRAGELFPWEPKKQWFLVLDAKSSMIKSGEKINQRENYKYNAHEIRTRQNIIIKLNKDIFSSLEKFWENVIWEEKVSYEFTFGRKLKCTCFPCFKKHTRMVEVKVDFGHSVKVKQIIAENQKDIARKGTHFFLVLDALSFFSGTTNVLAANQATLTTAVSFTLVNLAMASVRSADSSDFPSSLYFLLSPQGVYDIELRKERPHNGLPAFKPEGASAAAELRVSPALKLNLKGKLPPSDSGMQD